MTNTIIIGDGLTNDILSPLHQFQGVKGHVGQREIERLFGKGRAFGEGPLPTFLRYAVTSSARAAGVGVLLIHEPRPEESQTSSTTSHSSDPASFVGPVRELSDEATVIQGENDIIPWQSILQAVQELTGVDPTSSNDSSAALKFLVVGCHTEARILTITAFLRRILGFTDVAVSSHLVGSATLEAHPQSDCPECVLMVKGRSGREARSASLELILPNDLAEIERVMREFEAFAHDQGIDAATAKSSKVVFDELLNNIISYGYKDDRRHEIEVQITLSQGQYCACGSRTTAFLSIG